MKERLYYLSWVDQRTDPWPQWQRIAEAAHTGSAFRLDDQAVRLLPADHPLWPGVPLLEGEGALRVRDPRMGEYHWPGVNFQDGGHAGRLYLGPTLSALFHPHSRFHDFADLTRIYLLSQTGREGPQEELRRVCRAIASRRFGAKAADKVRLVGIDGVEDPTHHESIMKGIQHWLEQDDPFDFGGRDKKTPARIVVNLSSGTPSMQACWLMLRWNGKLGGERSTVEFVQGDGGLGAGDQSPLRPVPIDQLAQAPAQAPPAPAAETAPCPDTVRLDELIGPPYDALRQKIDQAAMLGLPILLSGERGTGKTFLAHYYHERRRPYRHTTASPDAPDRRPRPRKNVPPGTWLPYRGEPAGPEAGERSRMVTVTLSEFADLDNLRDTLFGWAEGSWTGALEAYDGLLGEAHGGTLFLDEVHHLSRSLQAALLGPFNNRRYRPKMAVYEIASAFDLVVATNDPQWRSKMADDFRDRIERIVLEVPAFRSFQRRSEGTLEKFWECTLRGRCRECGITHTVDGDWPACRERLRGFLRVHPLPGNWRDLQRLADNYLLAMTAARDGCDRLLYWDKEALEHAIGATFDEI